jgi:hypothetical protein
VSNNQLWLWPEVGEFEPYPKRHFPDEAKPTLERLFYLGIETTRIGPECPYRVGINTKLALKCDCQFAYDLVRLLGRNQPSCSSHRCPVRQILAEADER